MYPSIIIMLLILISGYIFVIRVFSLRYSFKRTENWGAYLLVATHGLWIVFLAWLLVSFANSIGIIGKVAGFFSVKKELLTELVLPSIEIGHQEDKVIIIKDYLRTGFVFLISISLAFIIPKFPFFFSSAPHKRALLIDKLSQNNPLEYLLFRASKDLKKPLLITLKSNKIYIGWVRQPRLEHGKLEYISIIPLLSGHRKEDTLEVVIIENYSRIYIDNNPVNQDDLTEFDIEDFNVVLPVSEIVSISYFNINKKSIKKQKMNTGKSSENI